MNKNKQKSEEKVEKSAKDYELIGRMLENIYESNYASRHRLYWLSFVKGIFVGFGGFIGATIVVAILIWGLSFFDFVPYVDRVIDSLQSEPQAP